MQTVPCHARCPGCGEPLVQLDTSDCVVAGCTRCGGLWVDNRVGGIVLSGALSDHIKAFAESMAATARSTAGQPPPGYRDRGAYGVEARACPVCAEPLRRRRVRDGDVDVDLCGEHGTFFDSRELVLVAQSVEARHLGDQARRAQMADRVAEARASETAASVVGDVILTALLGPPRPRWM